ncbi:MAG: hypothetical protein ACXVCP_15845 [Bdellovibrio sp.]
MNIYKKLILLLGVAMLTNPIIAKAEDEIEKAETQISKEASQPDFINKLKEKYNLTDEQVKKLQDSKLPEPQLAIVAALAKESGKSIDDILKMRTEKKEGWGKIAKELGLDPKLIGQSVAAMHRQNEDKDKKEDKKEKREARQDKKDQRDERRTARKEAQDQRGGRKNQ